MKRIASLLTLLATLALVATAAAQSPDTDGDGVPDSTDRCPTEMGSSVSGCPIDIDGDGVEDGVDACPGPFGTAEHQGCPFGPGDTDSDGDGIRDNLDNCPTQPSRQPRSRGCPAAAPTPTPTPVQNQTATSVEPGGVSIKRQRNALRISGIAFGAVPDMSLMTPKRLTIWLPKGVTAGGAACRESVARSLKLSNAERCTQMFGGRLNGEPLRAWQAYAGPKQGKRQRLWLRGITLKSQKFEGFATGWIAPASRGRTKITLELGALGFQTRGLEVSSVPAGRSVPLRGTCRGVIRMELKTAQGTAAKNFRC